MKIIPIIIVLISITACQSSLQKKTDWEGCELVEPDFIKEKRDSLENAKK